MRGWGLGTLLFFWSCAEADTGGLLQGPSDAGSPASDSGGPNPLPDSGVTVPDSGGPIVPGPEAETFKSGTRLRAAVLDAGGGARRFHAWYDTVLGAYCSFERTIDGELYCLPVGGFAHHFRDLDCQEPTVVVTECNRSQLYFRGISELEDQFNWCQYERLDLGRRHTAYRAIGSERVDQVQYAGAGECYVDRTPNQEIYILEPVPLPTLVRGTATLQDRGGMLGVWRVYAEDGAEQDLAMVDRSRNTECTPVQGVDQCAPSRAIAYVSDEMFGDSCTQTLAAGGSDPNCQPELALEFEQPTGPLCRREAGRLRELGEAYFGPLYRVNQGQCEPWGELHPVGLMTVGPTVNRFHFPALERHRVGTGRLQVERYFSTSREPLPTSNELFVDGRTGNPCGLFEDPRDPGASVCLDIEEVAGALAAYADPNCQELIAVQQVWNSLGCVQQPRSLVSVYLGPPLGSPCGPFPRQLREVGPEHRGSIYSLDVDGRCELSERSAIPGRRAYAHRLGPVRGLEGYPRVRQLIE